MLESLRLREDPGTRSTLVCPSQAQFFQGVTFNDILAKKATGPVIPLVKDQYDTSNYEAYPDSIEEAPISVCTSGADLFASF